MSLLTDLVSHYKCDETSGNRADAHGSNTLVEHGSVGSSTGKINSAAVFNANAANYLEAASSAPFKAGASDWYTAGWFYKSGSGIYPIWGTGSGWQIYCRTGQVEVTFFTGSGTVAATKFMTVSTGQWYFVEVWRTGGTTFIDVNRSGSPGSTTDGYDETFSGPLNLARDQVNGFDVADELIDEVSWRVGSIPTTAERNLLYNSGRGREYPFYNGPTAIPAAVWFKGGGTYWQDSARTTSASADTDPVGSWYDESYGLGYAIQGTAGSRPTLQTAEVNGVSATQYDGVDDILTSPVEVASGTPVTVIAVLRLLADGSFTYAIGDASSFRGIRITSGRTVSLCDGAQDIASPTPIAGDWVIVTGILDGTNGTLRVNGVQKATAASTVTGWIGGLTVGGRGSTPANFQNCQVAEVLLYDSALSGTDLTDVEDYLTAKYFAAGGGTTVTPGTASLSLTTFAPTVSTPRTVTPSAVALSLTSFTPTIQTPRLIVPGVAALSLSTFAPTVLSALTAIPETAALTITSFAPTVEAGGSQTVTPGPAVLSLTSFSPGVVTPRVVIPSAASLTLSTFVPEIDTPVVVVPGVRALTLTLFSPQVLIPRSVTPGSRALVLTTYAPIVSTGALALGQSWLASGIGRDWFAGAITRTWYAGDLPVVLNKCRKTPGDALMIFRMDFSDLPEFETSDIASITTVTATGLTVGSTGGAGTKVCTVALSGGEDGMDYDVVFTVVSDDGVTVQRTGVLEVRAK